MLRPLNPYFEEKNQGYRLVQEASQTETNSSKYDAFLVQKKNILHRDPKTCSARFSCKSLLYKNRFAYKLCVPGSTVTRVWVFLYTSTWFLDLFSDHPTLCIVRDASTSPKLNLTFFCLFFQGNTWSARFGEEKGELMESVPNLKRPRWRWGNNITISQLH